MSGKSDKRLRRAARKEIIVKYDEYWANIVEMPFYLRLLYCWHVMKRSDRHGRKKKTPNIIYPPNEG
jgi:hypothetical protein